MSECGRGLSVQLLMLSTSLAAAATGVEGVPGAVANAGEEETGGSPGAEAKIQDTAAIDLGQLEQPSADAGNAGRIAAEDAGGGDQYGPFHRLASTSQTPENLQESIDTGTLKGRPSSWVLEQGGDCPGLPRASARRCTAGQF
jgi:hypothetical protein